MSRAQSEREPVGLGREPGADTARRAGNDNAAVPPAGPGSWWRYGLLALAIVVAILLLMQIMTGNRQTDVIPGTPVTAPQTEVPVPSV